MIISLLFVCLGCAPTTTVIGGGEGGNDPGGKGDTGSNEDSGSNLDSAGDTGSDSGSDSGGDTDVDPTPADYAGEYRGDNEGLWNGGEWEAECSGEVRFTVAATGALEGSADCMFEGDGEDFAIEGDLLGEVDVEGVIALTWVVDFGRETMEVAGEGQIADKDAFVELFADLGRAGEYSGEMNARRR